ncbi:MAG: uncharacterized protein A8A55_0799 [Amphiamblys sp. WSBS2006]|nr:MAG: uncharacterized protein A8A55_0799 [Amphiamblys sp. WSBS2006]
MEEINSIAVPKSDVCFYVFGERHLVVGHKTKSGADVFFYRVSSFVLERTVTVLGTVVGGGVLERVVKAGGVKHSEWYFVCSGGTVWCVGHDWSIAERKVADSRIACCGMRRGKLVCVLSDGAVVERRAREIRTGDASIQAGETANIRVEAGDRVVSVGVSRKQICVGTKKGVIEIVGDGLRKTIKRNNEKAVVAVCYVSEKKVFVGIADGDVELWNVARGTLLRRFYGGGQPVREFVFRSKREVHSVTAEDCVEYYVKRKPWVSGKKRQNPSGHGWCFARTMDAVARRTTPSDILVIKDKKETVIGSRRHFIGAAGTLLAVGINNRVTVVEHGDVLFYISLGKNIEDLSVSERGDAFCVVGGRSCSVYRREACGVERKTSIAACDGAFFHGGVLVVVKTDGKCLYGDETIAENVCGWEQSCDKSLFAMWDVNTVGFFSGGKLRSIPAFEDDVVSACFLSVKGERAICVVTRHMTEKHTLHFYKAETKEKIHEKRIELADCRGVREKQENVLLFSDSIVLEYSPAEKKVTERRKYSNILDVCSDGEQKCLVFTGQGRERYRRKKKFPFA